MAESAYNKLKNASIGHILFGFNCRYYSGILFEDDANPYSKSRSTKEIAIKRIDLIAIYQPSLLYAQEL